MDAWGRLKRIGRKADAYKRAFGGDDGEWVLSDIMKEAGLSQPSYVQGDPGHSAYLEGMRRLGLYITNMVNMTNEEARRIAGIADETEQDSEEGGTYYG